ncbi:Uncharacterized protein APZ42_029004 [Daphnia magna]|uniref:Uncharacterized protein n=1 Tax=Daphnia magna TaxID=35525 RepID=A0A164Q079_9CRUS|nr:Uncharacterized protein APZ42_029004 [Daphnia magna]
MSSSLKTPEPFSFGASDLASQWKLWRRQFEWYLIATRTDAEEDVDEEKQVVGEEKTVIRKFTVSLPTVFVNIHFLSSNEKFGSLKHLCLLTMVAEIKRFGGCIYQIPT